VTSPRLSDRPLDELLDRAWDRSRFSARARVQRLRSKAWHVAQCALSAGLAWFVAKDLVGHPTPFFAPIVAIVCLGMTYGQRLRRVAEVTVGVALGLVVADVFVSVFGNGGWQIALIVGVAMSSALLLDAGGLLVIQAAVQSVFITAVGVAPGQAFTRWLDALIGGAVALAAAAIVPHAPLRRPRVQASLVLGTIAELLRGVAESTGGGDIEHRAERAAEILASARATEALIRELQAAADEGLSVIASSPFRRSEGQSVRKIADLVEPLDRAMRSTRVLARRVSIGAYRGHPVPPSYAEVMLDLARAVDIVRRALAENAHPQIGRAGLVAVGRRTAVLERGNLSTDALLVQIRSLIVDLLQLTGLDDEEALAAVPALPEQPPPEQPPPEQPPPQH